jgi:hypothetical protein
VKSTFEFPFFYPWYCHAIRGLLHLSRQITVGFGHMPRRTIRGKNSVFGSWFTPAWGILSSADLDRPIYAGSSFSSLIPEGTTMKRTFCVAFILVVAGLAGISRAEDKKADPTGTWKWSVTRNNQTFEPTLKLKFEGEKLTGTISGQDNQETTIDDAKFKDGEVSFAVTRERNGQKRTTKYKGKLDGDTIKGKSERERNGQNMETDWEAKREKK